MRTAIGCCLLAAVTLTPCAARAQIVNGGFETIEVTTAPGNGPLLLPGVTGDWQGDQSMIITTQQGITPFQGQRMLHFIATTATGPSSTVASQVWQTVDMTPFSTMISTGNATATFRYWVNRVNPPVPPPVDTAFSAVIAAHSGLPANFVSNPVPLSQNSAGLLSDGNPATWQPITVSLNLPVTTTYLAIQIAAGENIFNDVTGTEFAGHYADAAFLQVVPEPASLALVAGALMLLTKRRTRREPN